MTTTPEDFTERLRLVELTVALLLVADPAGLLHDLNVAEQVGVVVDPTLARDAAAGAEQMRSLLRPAADFVAALRQAFPAELAADDSGSTP